MTRKIFSLLIVAIAFIAFSCDEIDKPYVNDNSGGGGTTTDQVVRKVLIEEFTGHRCVNCPSGHLIVDELLEEYGDTVISIAIHSGFLSTPTSSPFEADYRTTAGDDITSNYNVQLYPAALINRAEQGTTYDMDSWKSTVRSLLYQDATLSIDITPSYNEGASTLDATIDITMLTAGSDNLNICVFVTESGIVSAQSNNDTNISEDDVILDYEHNHMLRGSMNGSWGELITNAEYAVNDEFTFTYEGFDASGMNADNMSIVAFVFNQQTHEVLQAEEIHVN